MKGDVLLLLLTTLGVAAVSGFSSHFNNLQSASNSISNDSSRDTSNTNSPKHNTPLNTGSKPETNFSSFKKDRPLSSLNKINVSSNFEKFKPSLNQIRNHGSNSVNSNADSQQRNHNPFTSRFNSGRIISEEKPVYEEPEIPVNEVSENAHKGHFPRNFNNFFKTKNLNPNNHNVESNNSKSDNSQSTTLGFNEKHRVNSNDAPSPPESRLNYFSNNLQEYKNKINQFPKLEINNLKSLGPFSVSANSSQIPNYVSSTDNHMIEPSQVLFHPENNILNTIQTNIFENPNKYQSNLNNPFSHSSKNIPHIFDAPNQLPTQVPSFCTTEVNDLYQNNGRFPDISNSLSVPSDIPTHTTSKLEDINRPPNPPIHTLSVNNNSYQKVNAINSHFVTNTNNRVQKINTNPVQQYSILDPNGLVDKGHDLFPSHPSPSPNGSPITSNPDSKAHFIPLISEPFGPVRSNSIIPSMSHQAAFSSNVVESPSIQHNDPLRPDRTLDTGAILFPSSPLSLSPSGSSVISNPDIQFHPNPSITEPLSSFNHNGNIYSVSPSHIQHSSRNLPENSFAASFLNAGEPHSKHPLQTGRADSGPILLQSSPPSPTPNVRPTTSNPDSSFYIKPSVPESHDPVRSYANVPSMSPSYNQHNTRTLSENRCASAFLSNVVESSSIPHHTHLLTNNLIDTEPVLFPTPPYTQIQNQHPLLYNPDLSLPFISSKSFGNVDRNENYPSITSTNMQSNSIIPLQRHSEPRDVLDLNVPIENRSSHPQSPQNLHSFNFQSSSTIINDNEKHSIPGFSLSHPVTEPNTFASRPIISSQSTGTMQSDSINLLSEKPLSLETDQASIKNNFPFVNFVNRNSNPSAALIKSCENPNVNQLTDTTLTIQPRHISNYPNHQERDRHENSTPKLSDMPIHVHAPSITSNLPFEYQGPMSPSVFNNNISPSILNRSPNTIKSTSLLTDENKDIFVPNISDPLLLDLPQHNPKQISSTDEVSSLKHNNNFASMSPYSRHYIAQVPSSKSDSPTPQTQASLVPLTESSSRFISPTITSYDCALTYLEDDDIPTLSTASLDSLPEVTTEEFSSSLLQTDIPVFSAPFLTSVKINIVPSGGNGSFSMVPSPVASPLTYFPPSPPPLSPIILDDSRSSKIDDLLELILLKELLAENSDCDSLDKILALLLLS